MTPHASPSGTIAADGNPLRVRDFRLLFFGETVSLVGDAFAIVALPLLVLTLTADPLVLGSVLALMGIPRALFMLVGGAIVDRFSPRRVMLGSNAVRFALVSLLGAAVLGGAIQVWMVYAFGLAFGLADAFYLPGQSAMLPRILRPGQLPAGNAFVGAAAQLALIVGPILAGVLIGAIAGADRSLVGIGIAFAIDGASFAVSLTALSLMASQRVERTSTTLAGLLGAVGDGLRFVWSRPSFRSLLLLIVAVQAIIVGPFGVGLPVIVEQRFGDASAYGLVMAAFGGGALGGMILAGILPAPRPTVLGPTILVVSSGLGFGLAAIALVPWALGLAAIAVVIGLANGYIGILLSAWLQPRVPTELAGRVMSLVMFAFVAVVPLSSPIAGALLAIDPVLTFLGAGVLMAVLVLTAATRPAFRQLGLEPLAEVADARPAVVTEPSTTSATEQGAHDAHDRPAAGPLDPSYAG